METSGMITPNHMINNINNIIALDITIFVEQFNTRVLIRQQLTRKHIMAMEI